MIKCPICKNEQNEEDLVKLESDCRFLSFNDVSQHIIRYQCNICDVIFGPLDMLSLSKERLSEMYVQIHNSGYREADSTGWEYDLFNKLNPQKDKIYINWGAGFSRASEIAKQNGFTLLNYDPGLPLNLQQISLKKIMELKVDGIISNNVLDHLQDPIADLYLMKSLLKEDGSMIHCSDGFQYNAHYTKFHLFFFIGKSVDYISVGMNYEFLPSTWIGMNILKLTHKLV